MERSIRILLLEDQAYDVEIILRELRRGGIQHVCRSVAAKEGFAGALEEFRPDVILADYKVAGFDGLEALAIARSQCPEAPVIIVTGALGEELATETIKRGASDFVLKDHLSQLVPALLRALREAEERRQRRQAEVLLEVKHQQLRLQNDALQRSEERFRQLAESIHEVFWMTDVSKSQLLYISPAYETIWGRPCQSLYDSPLNWIEAIHPEDRQRVLEAALTKQALRQYSEEYRIVRPNGDVRWVQDRAFPIRDESGEVYRIAGIAEDITERKLAEQQLAIQHAKVRESEWKLRLIAENTREVFFLYDMARTPLYVNPAIEALTGYTVAEHQASKFINWIHPEDQERMLGLWERLFAGESYSGVEYRMVTKSGQLKWCSSSWGPIHDESGCQIGVQGTESDISERKHLEREVLESATNERRRIGHDLHDGLCQFLSGIAFRAKALEQSLVAQSPEHALEAGELVTLLGRSIAHARALARGLDPVEIESVGLPAALQNLAAETEKFFDTACLVRCDDIGPAPDAPTALALFRIVQEAIQNAINHGQARRIEIKLAGTSRGLALGIQDDGSGFEATTRSNGMGLRVMQYRARSVGGQLDVLSQPGKGTRIKCIVPRTAVP